jgi:hypothetical protein
MILAQTQHLSVRSITPLSINHCLQVVDVNASCNSSSQGIDLIEGWMLQYKIYINSNVVAKGKLNGQ